MPHQKRAAKAVIKHPTPVHIPLPIVWTSRARSDLEAIGDYIARDNVEAPQRWVMKLVHAAETAAAAPFAGRRVPEIDRDDVREVFVGSYRVVYHVISHALEVLTVFEGHRLLPLRLVAADQA